MANNFGKAQIKVTINLGKVHVYVDTEDKPVAKLNAMLKKKVVLDLEPGEHQIKFVNPQAKFQRVFSATMIGLAGGAFATGLGGLSAGAYAGTIIGTSLSHGSLQNNEAVVSLAPGDRITFKCVTGIIDCFTGNFKVKFSRD